MSPSESLAAAARAPRLRLALLVGGSAVAFVVLYARVAAWLWSAWTSDPYYTHGIPVAFVALGLAAWRARKARAQPEVEVPAWALTGVPLAAALYLVGLMTRSAYLMAWSGLALAAALALATGGPRRLRAHAAPLLLFALVIPIPWMIEVGARMQDLAFATSAGLLVAVGLPLERGVTTFATGGITFDVTAACSGFQSAVSLLAIGALLAAIAPMTPARRRLVLISAVPIALALNVARILATVAVGLGYGADAARGFFHGWSGLLIFLAETAILLAIAGQLAPRQRDERAEVAASD